MTAREKILKAKDRALTAMFVPEWNEAVYLPGNWSLADHGQISKSQELSDPNTKIAAQVVLIARNADGSQMFSEEDIAGLMQKNSDILFRIIHRFNELHGSDAEKNSTTPASDSAT